MLPAFACLATAAAALTATLTTPVSALRIAHSQRSRQLCAQLAPGWVTGVDEQSGHLYWYNQQTGESQWEPPHAAHTGESQWQPPHAATAQVMWIVAPADGVFNEYTVRNGEEQVLGRYDMVEQDPYVSRVQCLVRVAADGSASVVSLGKAQTFILQPSEMLPSGEYTRRMVVLRKDEEHVLRDSEQIALRKNHQTGAMIGIFTVYAQQDEYGVPGGSAQPSAYAQVDRYAGEEGYLY